MNLCRCERGGHFYDKEKFAECPYCKVGNIDTDLTEPFTDGSGGTQPANGWGGLPISPIPASDETVSVDIPTADYFENGQLPGNEPFSMNNEQLAVNNGQSLVNNGQPAVNQQNSFMWEDRPKGPNVTVSPDETTVAYYYDDDISAVLSPVNSKPFINTPGQAAPNINKRTSPCVGWLIAMGGEHIGHDFRLKVGKNFIGRDMHMDVALPGEISVSRDRHATVVYEPRENIYLVMSGDSSSLAYHNNQVVLEPKRLEAYDMITVGKVNLLFIPLCNGKFNWGDLFDEIKKKNKQEG